MSVRPMLFAAAFVALSAGQAFAHAAILSCYDEDNGTIECEAGYSDGSPAANQTIRVLDSEQRLILQDKFKADSTFNFPKPDGDFTVEFQGDPSHLATFYSDDL